MSDRKYGEPCKHGAMLRHLCSDCLTEGLAQAERERDEWKRKHANLASGSDGLVRQAAQYRDERDAALADLKIARHALGEALAKAEEWEKEARRMDAEIGFGHARENELREKSEAAEKDAGQRYKECCTVTAGFNIARDELADLRARIEALADEADSGGPFSAVFRHTPTGRQSLGDALRALLTPPKAESALDVLSRIEKWGNTDEPMGAIIEDLAKLRKLLEEK